jgi:hypothetical protein
LVEFGSIPSPFFEEQPSLRQQKGRWIMVLNFLGHYLKF